jgi:hypothetical protein
LHIKAGRLIRATVERRVGDAQIDEGAIRQARRYLELWPQKSSDCWEHARELAYPEKLQLDDPVFDAPAPAVATV